MKKVAVIGAGWAGAACAWQLQRQGLQVTVFESAPVIGGRARRVPAPWGKIDNGQHLLIGAYRATLDLMSQLGLATDTRFYKQDLRFQSLDNSFSFGYWPLKSPWHQLGIIFGGRGIRIRDKIALLRLMGHLKKIQWQPTAGQTVAQLLDRCGQSTELIKKLWEPLCVAALNTPIHIACARIFAAVLRDSLGAGRDSTQLLIPLTDMSELWAQTALRNIPLYTGTPIQRLEYDAQHRITLFGSQNLPVCNTPFDYCVIATQIPPALRLLRSIPTQTPEQQDILNALAAIRFNPIATLYLQPQSAWTVPTPLNLLFENCPQLHLGQWVFNHAALANSFARHTISVVISDAALLKAHPKDQITTRIIEQIKAQTPAQHPLPKIVDSMLITEQRATFLATPHLKRPQAHSPWPGIYFAADWVDSEYPAVLEGAVRSGLETARLIASTLPK